MGWGYYSTGKSRLYFSRTMNHKRLIAKLVQNIELPPEKMFFCGLEKESMRASQDGKIATSPHPHSLGSALTHPYITTDFTESLLEIVSPPFSQINELMDFMARIHGYISHHIGEEIIWPASMPPRITNSADIKIAEYGSSYPGRIRHIYRKGLALRYGKMMQTIAGIHFNFSFSADFIEMRKNLLEENSSKNDLYFHIMRNYIRLSWLVNYLFGASPMIDKSFLNQSSIPDFLKPFGKSSYIHPLSTCLRMSRLGYTNLYQDDLPLCFNNLEDYLATMRRMLSTSDPNYLKAGIKINGEYQQLNANQLQVENEYYASIRPKANRSFTEKTIDMLISHGVEYLEIRNLDLDPFLPFGIAQEQLLFLQLLFCYCSLIPSPKVDASECHHIRCLDEKILMHNMTIATKYLKDERSNRQLAQVGLDILNSMMPLAQTLESLSSNQNLQYSLVLKKQIEKLTNTSLLPAKQLIDYTKTNGQDFISAICQLAAQHKKHYRIDETQEDELAQISQESHLKQLELEIASKGNFDDFIASYLGTQQEQAQLS